MKNSSPKATGSASELISKRIAELGDWRGEMLGRVRALIKEADPEILEEWKWMGTPIWSHDGIVCTGESYKKVVKMTFAKGAALKDPSRLFNSSLEGNVRRAIDIQEGEKLKEAALKALIREAVALNVSSKKAKAAPAKAKAAPTPTKGAPAKSKTAPARSKPAPAERKATSAKTKAAPARR